MTHGQLDGSSTRREPLLDPRWGPTIQDLVGLQPSSSRHRHAVLHERKTRRVMGVAVDGNQAASLTGAVGMGWIQVETRRIGVDFQGGSSFRGDSEHPIPVEISTLSPFDQSTRRVSNDVHIGVLKNAN
jgi:glycine cleavage system aminomethyltransferase T